MHVFVHSNSIRASARWCRCPRTITILYDKVFLLICLAAIKWVYIVCVGRFQSRSIHTRTLYLFLYQKTILSGRRRHNHIIIPTCPFHSTYLCDFYFVFCVQFAVCTNDIYSILLNQIVYVIKFIDTTPAAVTATAVKLSRKINGKKKLTAQNDRDKTRE